jgi:GNAT superfamily N-acetyltransferase
MELTGLRWRLTRNRYTRSLYEALAARGVRAAKMDLYVRSGADPPERSPDGVRFEAMPADTVDPADCPEADDLESDDRVVLARVDGTVAGYVFVSDRPVRVAHVGRRLAPEGAYVWRLFVDPAYRERGIGTALVAQAVATGRKAFGTASAAAVIAVDNDPSKLAFRANGFEPAERLTYYRVGPWEHRATETL